MRKRGRDWITFPVAPVARPRKSFGVQNELIALLAGRRGHFQMESGYHSDQWFELDRLLRQRERLAPFFRELARRLAAHRPEVICGPETGGAQLAAMIGAELGIDAVAAERFEPAAATGLFPVRYAIRGGERNRVRGRRVVIVDDAVSAGSAVRGTHANLLACGAQPVAIGALFVFGGAAARFATDSGLALEGIAPMDFSLWPPDACPLCRAGVAVERVSDASPPSPA